MELTISFFIIRPCLLLQYFDQRMKACEVGGRTRYPAASMSVEARCGAVRLRSMSVASLHSWCATLPTIEVVGLQLFTLPLICSSKRTRSDSGACPALNWQVRNDPQAPVHRALFA